MLGHSLSIDHDGKEWEEEGGRELRWGKPLIPALGRQKQVDLCEFEANLVYIVPGQTGLHREEILSPKQTNKVKEMI